MRWTPPATDGEWQKESQFVCVLGGGVCQVLRKCSVSGIQRVEYNDFPHPQRRGLGMWHRGVLLRRGEGAGGGGGRHRRHYMIPETLSARETSHRTEGPMRHVSNFFGKIWRVPFWCTAVRQRAPHDMSAREAAVPPNAVLCLPHQSGCRWKLKVMGVPGPTKGQVCFTAPPLSRVQRASREGRWVVWNLPPSGAELLKGAPGPPPSCKSLSGAGTPPEHAPEQKDTNEDQHPPEDGGAGAWPRAMGGA